MFEDKTVSAEFSEDEVVIGSSLTVTITDFGGAGANTVVADNHGNSCLINTPCPAWTYLGAEVGVTITATPAAVIRPQRCL